MPFNLCVVLVVCPATCSAIEESSLCLLPTSAICFNQPCCTTQLIAKFLCSLQQFPVDKAGRRRFGLEGGGEWLGFRSL